MRDSGDLGRKFAGLTLERTNYERGQVTSQFGLPVCLLSRERRFAWRGIKWRKSWSRNSFSFLSRRKFGAPKQRQAERSNFCSRRPTTPANSHPWATFSSSCALLSRSLARPRSGQTRGWQIVVCLLGPLIKQSPPPPPQQVQNQGCCGAKRRQQQSGADFDGRAFFSFFSAFLEAKGKL